MSLFPTVAKNTLAQILGRAVFVLMTISLTSVLTRVLGVEVYGDYTFIITLVLFFVSMADWGTNLIAVREVVKESHDENKVFGNVLLFRLGAALVSFLFLNLLTLVIPSLKVLALPIQIASFLLVSISLKTSCHVVFQTKLKFNYQALTDVLVSALFLFILLVALTRQNIVLTLPLVIFLFVLANGFGSLLALSLAGQLAKFDFRLDRQLLSRILKEALPTGALLLVFAIYNRLDIFLLKFFQGAESVGIYGLAYKVHDNLVLGSAYLAAALFPLLSKIAHNPQERAQLKLIYQKIFGLLTFAAVFLLVLVLVLAPVIISIIGGSGFTESSLVLRILVFATALAYLNHLTGYTLIALGKQRVSLIVAIVALIWNLTLNLLFIPRYSYLAASVLTISTELLVLFLTSLYLAKNFSLTPNFNFIKTLLELVKSKGRIF